MSLQVKKLFFRQSSFFRHSRVGGNLYKILDLRFRGDDNRLNGIKSFTLTELLITIAVIAVMSAAVVIVLNPVEFLGQSRDATRVSDMDTLNTAVGLYASDVRGFKGEANKVYISIPDTNADCSGISGLPTLPSGWLYSCVTEANLINVDGTGWLPVNLNALPGGSTIQKLPTDPTNTAASGLYYVYIGSDSYELNSVMESNQFKIGGSRDQVSTDGGDDPYLYEVGSSLSKYKREVLTNATFGTGNFSGWTNWAGGSSIVSTPSHYNQRSAVIQNSNSYCNNYYVQDISVIPNTVYSIGAWVKTVNEVGSSFVGIANTSWGGWVESTRITGTRDWVYLSTQKNSGALTTMRFFLSVGWCGGSPPGSGPSGTTYFSTPSVMIGTKLLNN